MKTKKIRVAASIGAKRERVWKYFTQPEHITQWNFATHEWHCPKAENELKAGGKYFARMEARDGSMGFDLEAVYDEVTPQKQITYTMSDGRKVTTSFDELKDKTAVTTTFDAESTNSVEMQRKGWQQIMDNFKRYAEEENLSDH